MGRRRNGALNNAANKKDWYISLEALIIQFVGLFGATILYLLVKDDPVYPSLGQGTLKFFMFFGIGLILQLAANIIRFGSIKIGIRWDVKENTPWNKNTLWQLIIVMIALAIVQVTVFVITAIKPFQVTASQVYAYYVLAAVAEESLFRGGIIPISMVIVQLYVDFKKHENSRRKSEFERQFINLLSNESFQGGVGIAISASIFAIAHQAYWQNAPLIIGTLISGIFLGISFYQSKGNLLITILPHALINAGNANSIVQTLKV